MVRKFSFHYNKTEYLKKKTSDAPHNIKIVIQIDSAKHLLSLHHNKKINFTVCNALSLKAIK